jgi:elongator complex protein 5
VLGRKYARDKSLAEPSYGLEEGTEGVLRGLGSNDSRGIIVEMEYRRKSGRGVKETFFLSSATSLSISTALPVTSQSLAKERDRVILLVDHPLYKLSEQVTNGAPSVEGTQGADIETTFNLGLTEKQRKDREGVVLPYFDAQKLADGTAGEGGRILYDMGVEDDFDEEEDDI